MEEFLTDYIQMIAESRELELNPQQVATLVNRMAAEEALWDTVDFYIHEAFDKLIEEVM